MYSNSAIVFISIDKNECKIIHLLALTQSDVSF